MIKSPGTHEYRDRYSGNPYGYPPDPQQFGMAAHEAAHAVVAAALGFRVTRVTVERRANSSLSWDGVCEYRGASEWDASTRATREAAVAVAAYAGQQALEGPVRWQLPDRVFGGDADQLQGHADTLGVDSHDLREMCLDSARRLLTDHADAWRMVTYALMRYGEIDGAYLERIDAALFATPATEPAATPDDATFRDEAIAALTYFQRNPPTPGSRAHELLDRLDAVSARTSPRLRAPSYRVGTATVETRMGGPIEYRSGR